MNFASVIFKHINIALTFDITVIHVFLRRFTSRVTYSHPPVPIQPLVIFFVSPQLFHLLFPRSGGGGEGIVPFCSLRSIIAARRLIDELFFRINSALSGSGLTRCVFDQVNCWVCEIFKTQSLLTPHFLLRVYSIKMPSHLKSLKVFLFSLNASSSLDNILYLIFSPHSLFSRISIIFSPRCNSTRLSYLLIRSLYTPITWRHNGAHTSRKRWLSSTRGKIGTVKVTYRYTCMHSRRIRVLRKILCASLYFTAPPLSSGARVSFTFAQFIGDDKLAYDTRDGNIAYTRAG